MAQTTSNRFADLVHPELTMGKYMPSMAVWNPFLRFLLRGLDFLVKLLARPPSTISGKVVHIPSLDSPATIETYIARPKSSLPSKPLPAILWIHSGGLVTGSYQIEYGLFHPFVDPHPFRLPDGCIVVSPNYRLAVNHPAPAQGDDCFATWLWMVEHAEELGIDTDRIVLAGASAGGGLSALLAQRILDYNRSIPSAQPYPVLQLLFFPMLDDRTVSRMDAEVASGYKAVSHYPIFGPKAKQFGWKAYLGGKAGVAGIVPARREDLAGLPPAWIGVGSLDLFLTEDVEYARRLKEAGVEVTLEVVEGGWHGFNLCEGTKVVDEFVASQYRVLKRVLA